MVATITRGQRVQVIGTPERFDRAGQATEAKPPRGNVVTSVDVDRVIVLFDDGTLAVVDVRLCGPV